MLVAHVSDVHIDATQHAGTDRLRQQAWSDNQQVLAQVVWQALERGVDVFCHAGDAFANGRPTPEALLMFAQTLRPLLDEGVPVVLIEGNHERLQRRTGMRSATEVLAEMLAKHGEVHALDQGQHLLRTNSGLQIACVPWVDAGRVLADNDALGLDEVSANQLVAKEVLHRFEQILDDADDQAPLIGMSHLAVGSAQRSSEGDLTALFREPVVDADSLAALGMGYVALGHIHRAQKLAEGVYYSGSPQRFTFTDEQDKKGWNLVRLSDSGRLEKVSRVITGEARNFLTVTNPEDAVDVPEQALVRVMLTEGMDRVPEPLEQAVKSAGGRIVEQVPFRTAQLAQVVEMSHDISDVDALTQWVGEHHPNVDAAALLRLACELEDVR